MGGAYATDPQVSSDTNNISTYSDNIQNDNSSDTCIVTDENSVESNNNIVLGSNRINENLMSSSETVNLLGEAPKNGVYYVDNSTQTSNPDGSAESPFNNITDAVSAINKDTSFTGDFTVNIAPGTYKENSIEIKKNITFNGTGDNVIINGQEGQIFTTPSTDDSVYNIVFNNLTLTNATVTGNGSVLNIGKNGNVKVTDSRIENNTAKGTGAIISVYGGAIYVNTGNVTVTGSSFNNNTVSAVGSASYGSGEGYGYGGAISVSTGNVTVTGSSFNNNTVSAEGYGGQGASMHAYGYGYGGAISVNTGNITVNGSYFIINNVTAIGNDKKTTIGSTIYIGTAGSVSVEYSVFLNNTCSDGDVSNTIYAPGSVTADTNWWGNNTPDFKDKLIINDTNKVVSPTDYVTVNVTSSKSDFIVEFLNNNTGKVLTNFMPARPITLNSTTGVTITPSTGEIKNNIFKSIITSSKSDNIVTVTVDNEVFDTNVKFKISTINTTSTIFTFVEGTVNMVYVTLYDADGEKLSKDIYYTFDDGKEGGPCTGGISIYGLSLGEHTLKYYFKGDTEYEASNNQTTINIISNPVPPINPTATVLVGEDLTTNKSTVDFTVTLKTVDGDVLGNESVLYILYNDEYHPVTTDSNGVATVTLNNLTVGTYSIRYVYFGNNLYASSNGVSTINVVNNSKADSNLKTSYEDNVLSFNLTSEGQPLSNQNISVNINGTLITLSTDKNGLTSIDLNNYTAGNYTVSYNYLGNEKVNGLNGSLNLTVTTSNITDVSTVLSVNNLTMTYGQALNLTGTLLDMNGNPIIGMHISLNLTNPLNGLSKIYHATTDNKGEYQLEINLYPGEYTVSATFDGLKTNTTNYLASGPVNSTISVNKVESVLTADKFTAKFGANQNFTGKLLNSNGEAVIGQHILIKLTRLSDSASKIYDVTTDTNGEYQLAINLFKGKYTAECSYTGTSIYSSSNASNSITVTA